MICALAVAGAIALGQMRRVAFFLLAAHFALSFGIQILRLPRLVAFSHRMSVTLPPAIADPLVMRVTSLIVAEWVISTLINILIVWYVYTIAWPKRPATSVIEAEAGA